MLQRRLVGPFVGALVLLTLGGTAWAQFGPGPPKEVEMTDDCEPVSFNAAIGPGTCVGNGTTTFGQFITLLITTGDVPTWRNIPQHFGVRSGQGLLVRNTGGEFHTYTEVAAFGGGCVEELNEILGLTPVPECKDPLVLFTTGAPAGGTVEVPGLERGRHRFMCLIHPWMTAEVLARGQ
jgi:hypothetical protein